MAALIMSANVPSLQNVAGRSVHFDNRRFVLRWCNSLQHQSNFGGVDIVMEKTDSAISVIANQSDGAIEFDSIQLRATSK